MLEAYLASDLYKRIPKHRQLREQSFTLYTDNGFIISGIIDCLAFKPDGSMLIVDYKTGRPPLHGEPEVGYAYQLAIYEKVVRERWARGSEGKAQPELNAELYFLRNNTAWNLQDARAQQPALPAEGKAVCPAMQGQAKDYFAEALELCEEISRKSKETEFLCKEQKNIIDKQKTVLPVDNVTEAEKNAKNIPEGLAYCEHCPYNYVCNHK